MSKTPFQQDVSLFAQKCTVDHPSFCICLSLSHRKSLFRAHCPSFCLGFTFILKNKMKKTLQFFYKSLKAFFTFWCTTYSTPECCLNKNLPLFGLILGRTIFSSNYSYWKWPCLALHIWILIFLLILSSQVGQALSDCMIIREYAIKPIFWTFQLSSLHIRIHYLIIEFIVFFFFTHYEMLPAKMMFITI